MRTRGAHFSTIFMLAGLFLIAAVLMTGCKKKSEPTKPSETEEVAAEQLEQTVCPVMAGPINKEFYTEYKGKKVYFCCAGCKETFEKEPEKYISKLPQFRE